jgi:hypothetical protein
MRHHNVVVPLQSIVLWIDQSMNPLVELPAPKVVHMRRIAMPGHIVLISEASWEAQRLVSFRQMVSSWLTHVSNCVGELRTEIYPCMTSRAWEDHSPHSTLSIFL